MFACKGGSYLDGVIAVVEERLDALSFTSRDGIVLVKYDGCQIVVHVCDIVTEDVTKCYKNSGI